MAQPRGTKRVLIAKPGLDGHDLGAKLIVRALVDAGFEVIYSGLRRTPEEIVRIAEEEDVEIIGLSIMSGSHLPICERIHKLLLKKNLEGLLLLVGGVIPRRDIPALKELGFAGVFGVGSTFASIVDFVKERVGR